MSYSLNSLKGRYIGDYIGDYCRGYLLRDYTSYGGLGFGVWGVGLGFRLWSLGFRVWGQHLAELCGDSTGRSSQGSSIKRMCMLRSNSEDESAEGNYSVCGP